MKLWEFGGRLFLVKLQWILVPEKQEFNSFAAFSRLRQLLSYITGLYYPMSLLVYYLLIFSINTTWNVSKYGVFSGPYFPAFGLSTEIYEVSFRIQSECGKIWTRKNSVFGHISRSVIQSYWKTLNNTRNFPKCRVTRESLPDR